MKLYSDIPGRRAVQVAADVGVVLWVVLAVATPAFFTAGSIQPLLVATAPIALVGVGMTIIIITGGIDLSVGTGMTLSAVMAGTFMVTWGMPVWLGIICTLLFGCFLGLINGTNVAILGLPPFIRLKPWLCRLPL